MAVSYTRHKRQSLSTVKRCCFLWYRARCSRQIPVSNWYCFHQLKAGAGVSDWHCHHQGTLPIDRFQADEVLIDVKAAAAAPSTDGGGLTTT